MKRSFTILAVALLTAAMWAQSPQKISYQAVVRDVSNHLVTTQVGMKISILQGSESGEIKYVEVQTPIPNANGLVTIQIGDSDPVAFAAINWAAGPYYIKTETATEAPLTTYTITGTSQLLSVPYALYAKRVGERYVGELYSGGVVIWIDQTGSHGLICSMIDLSTSQTWSNVGSTEIGLTAQSDWDGLSNSNAIVGQSEHSTSAAKLCLDYSNVDYGTGIYSDWYLPSRSELNHLFNNIYQVQKAIDSDGNIATTTIVKAYYWTSSESGSSNAWSFGFHSGGMASGYGKDAELNVRAVRSF
jgi:hypothetical protein